MDRGAPKCHARGAVKDEIFHEQYLHIWHLYFEDSLNSLRFGVKAFYMINIFNVTKM